MRWEELTWEEITALCERGMIAGLLPVGATEQHGLHLDVGMDTCLGEALCREVAQRTNVPMLPVLPYGCSLGHSHKWAGTLSLSPRTLIQLVSDIGNWFYQAGFRKLFIINSHVTNEAPLRCALEELRYQHDDFMIALLHTAKISPRVQERFFADATDWHANEAETSVMQYLAPARVREAKIAASDDPDRTTDCIFAHPVHKTSTTGTTGFPSQATPAKGEELFSWMVEDLSEIVLRGLNEKSPL